VPADTGTINVEVEAWDFGLESATIAHRAGFGRGGKYCREGGDAQARLWWGYITAGERLRIYLRLLVREDLDLVFLQYRREVAMWARTSSFRL
jgi:hypothetical protein